MTTAGRKRAGIHTALQHGRRRRVYDIIIIIIIIITLVGYQEVDTHTEWATRRRRTGRKNKPNVGEKRETMDNWTNK